MCEFAFKRLHRQSYVLYGRVLYDQSHPVHQRTPCLAAPMPVAPSSSDGPLREGVKAGNPYHTESKGILTSVRNERVCRHSAANAS